VVRIHAGQPAKTSYIMGRKRLRAAALPLLYIPNRFFDVQTGSRVQVSKSTLTDDHGIATKIANEVHRLLNNDSPTTDLHPRTYELVGIDPHDKQKRAIRDGMILLNVAAQFTGADASPTIDRVMAAVATLQKRLDTALQERNEWKRRAIASEGLLTRQGKQANKARAEIDGLTLADALEKWKKTLTGDVDYVRNQQGDAGMFVRKFGEKTLLTDVADQAKDVDLWIRSITKPASKKDIEAGNKACKPIGASRRQEIRRVVLRFLRESGAEMDAKAIKRPSKKDVRNDRGAIRWLTRDQAQAVAGKIADPYYADCFRIQLALGKAFPNINTRNLSNSTRHY